MNEFTAEIIGTWFLIFLGNSVVANVMLPQTKGNKSGWLVITTAWGLAVFVGVVVAAPYSGAHLNPAVSIGLAVAGKFTWAKVPVYIFGQFVGAMLGAFMVWLTYKDHFKLSKDRGLNLAVFSTSPAVPNTLSNLFSEVAGTFVLVFVIFYFTGGTIKSEGTPIGLGSVGAIPIALLVWVIGMSLGGTTGYAINPARDLGPRIIYSLLPLDEKNHLHWRYAWIPVVGPILGASIAAILYLLLNFQVIQK